MRVDSLMTSSPSYFLLLNAVSLLLCLASAQAQTQSAPIIGGTGGLSTNSDYGRFETTKARRHLNPANRPCISVHGLSKPQIINNNVYEHILILENVCNQPIKLRMCYFQSTNCISATVNAYSRKQQILGYGSNAKDFRYAYIEEF